MATEIMAAELLTLQAGDRKNRGLSVTKESAMAKYYSSEIAVKTATEAVQVFGGYGYTKDFPVEKFYRDSKLCTIGEGTSEIQKIVIAREVLNGWWLMVDGWWLMVDGINLKYANYKSLKRSALSFRA